MGATLRDACGTDAACASQVTQGLTRPCYAARYHDDANHSTPNDKVKPEQLSPCFWNDAPKHPSTSAEYAQQTCTTIVDTKLQPACVAELREVIDGICAEGSVDLTGAGP